MNKYETDTTMELKHAGLIYLFAIAYCFLAWYMSMQGNQMMLWLGWGIIGFLSVFLTMLGK